MQTAGVNMKSEMESTVQRVRRDLPVELQSQIAAQIETLIREKHLRPGDALPPVRTLAKTCGVSVVTVLRAIQELARRGLVRARSGSGTYVCEPSPATTEILIASPFRPEGSLSMRFFQQIDEGLREGYGQPDRRYAITFTNGMRYSAQEVLMVACARGSDGLVAYGRGEPIPECLADVARELPCVRIMPHDNAPAVDAVIPDAATAIHNLIHARIEGGQRQVAVLATEGMANAPESPHPYVQMLKAAASGCRDLGVEVLVNLTRAPNTGVMGQPTLAEVQLAALARTLPAGCTAVVETASIAEYVYAANPELDIVTYTESRHTLDLLNDRVTFLYCGLEIAAREAARMLRESKGRPSRSQRIRCVPVRIVERRTG